MSLHEEYYDLREKCWTALEELVRKGCDYIGEFPIIVGEYSLQPNGLRTGGVIKADNTDIVIHGVIADPNYSIFPPKENEKDINVYTNRIKVIIKSYINNTEEIVEVEPHITDLQSLSTYLSGGFSVYH